MKKIILVVLTLFQGLQIQAQELPKKESKPLDLTIISLDGLDEDVKKVFEETKSLIIKAREEGDLDTEFTATKSWCLLLHNYDFLQSTKSCYYKIGLDEKTNAKWPYLYGKAALDLGETQAAEVGFKEAVGRENIYLPAHYYLILSSLESGNLKTAFERLSAVPVELKLSSNILKLTGDLYFEVENYYVAIGYYQQALKLVPKAGNLNYKIARAYQSLEQMEMAEKYLEKSDSVGIKLIDPYYQEVKQQIVGEIPFLIRAKKALENGDAKAAIVAYEKALEFNPNSESGLINIAVAYFQTKQIEKAKSSFKSVLNNNPKQTKALFNLATILMSQNLFESAIEYFQKYLEIIPNDEEVIKNLTQLYYQTNQHHKVIELLIGDKDIKNFEVQFLKAKSLINLQKFDEAVSLLKLIKEQDESNIEVLLALAKIHAQVPDAKIRDSELALKYAEQAFELNKSAQSYWQLMMALDESNLCERLNKTLDEFSLAAMVQRSEMTSQFKSQRAHDLKCTVD
jgi:tetratricopeptide (TPR) repeat protein